MRNQLSSTNTVNNETSNSLKYGFNKTNFKENVKKVNREPLNKYFRKFYLSARKRDGTFYNKNLEYFNDKWSGILTRLPLNDI